MLTKNEYNDRVKIISCVNKSLLYMHEITLFISCFRDSTRLLSNNDTHYACSEFLYFLLKKSGFFSNTMIMVGYVRVSILYRKADCSQS